MFFLKADATCKYNIFVQNLRKHWQDNKQLCVLSVFLFPL